MRSTDTPGGGLAATGGIERAQSPGWRLPLRLSIIIPFHRNLAFLERSLAGCGPIRPGDEIIIAADAAVDDCHELAARYGARVLDLPGPNGPGVARNRAAEVALGDILVFIDADVVVSPEALDRLRATFADPDVDAVFGAYDESPAEPNFVSQYKNLAHSFIHQSSGTVAQTFWAGFGAVRASAFAAIGGFDERFRRPCVEDIDVGYRLTAAGYRVRLDHELRACHLKRWTLKGMVLSDVFDRGIPWTQLILRFNRFNNDLNLKSGYRACVVLAYLTVLSLMLAVVEPWLLAPVPVYLGTITYFGRRFYRFFIRKRGLLFTARLFPLHFLYHLYNGFSFATGTTLYVLNKRFGIQLPGALPLTPWEGPEIVPAAFASVGVEDVPSQEPYASRVAQP